MCFLAILEKNEPVFFFFKSDFSLISCKECISLIFNSHYDFFLPLSLLKWILIHNPQLLLLEQAWCLSVALNFSTSHSHGGFSLGAGVLSLWGVKRWRWRDTLAWALQTCPQILEKACVCVCKMVIVTFHTNLSFSFLNPRNNSFELKTSC